MQNVQRTLEEMRQNVRVQEVEQEQEIWFTELLQDKSTGAYWVDCPYCLSEVHKHHLVVKESATNPDVSIKSFEWEKVIKRIPKEAPNVLQFCLECGTQFNVSLWSYLKY